MFLPQGQPLGKVLFKFGHTPGAQRIGPHFVDHGLILPLIGESGGPSHTAPPAPTFLTRAEALQSMARSVVVSLPSIPPLPVLDQAPLKGGQIFLYSSVTDCEHISDR